MAYTPAGLWCRHPVCMLLCAWRICVYVCYSDGGGGSYLVLTWLGSLEGTPQWLTHQSLPVMKSNKLRQKDQTEKCAGKSQELHLLSNP